MSLRPEGWKTCPEHGHRLLDTGKIKREETWSRGATIICLCPDERDNVEYEVDT